MKIQVDAIEPANLQEVAVYLCVEGSFEQDPIFQHLNEISKNNLLSSSQEEGFSATKGQSVIFQLLTGNSCKRIVLLGAGSQKNISLTELRTWAAKAVRLVNALHMKKVSFLIPSLAIDDSQVAQALTEGAILGFYRFDKYWTNQRRKERTLEQISLVTPKSKGVAFEKGMQRGTILAGAISLSRDMVNEPAEFMSPKEMVRIAKDIAEKNRLSVKILSREDCQQLGMGLFLSVARGCSIQEPAFIHLTYRPQGPATKKIALIGKSITFDSGGLSLKTTDQMIDMKIDMAGGAAVLGIFSVLDQLHCPYEVHGILPCTENMISDRAIKLGDVMFSMSGKTVEMTNTDAEGRLVLGDAITYALREVKPDEMVDLATLTGACMVALGHNIAGVMSNNPELSAKLTDAARRAGEEMWPLPLPDRLFEQLKSEVADMRNSGERYGGALIAGLFLKEFVGSTPWVHIDMAGPVFAQKEWGLHVKGATGFGVATLAEYLVPTSV